jgi:hypothetical protein
MWRLWVIHIQYYDENITRCCSIREREFPENIVVLIRRRLVTFYSFIMCFYYQSFFTNGLRGSVIPCIYVAGNKDFVVDPLAGFPAINKYYRFTCTGKGPSVEYFTVTYFMVNKLISALLSTPKILLMSRVIDKLTVFYFYFLF